MPLGRTNHMIHHSLTFTCRLETWIMHTGISMTYGLKHFLLAQALKVVILTSPFSFELLKSLSQEQNYLFRKILKYPTTIAMFVVQRLTDLMMEHYFFLSFACIQQCRGTLCSRNSFRLTPHSSGCMTNGRNLKSRHGMTFICAVRTSNTLWACISWILIPCSCCQCTGFYNFTVGSGTPHSIYKNFPFRDCGYWVTTQIFPHSWWRVSTFHCRCSQRPSTWYVHTGLAHVMPLFTEI